MAGSELRRLGKFALLDDNDKIADSAVPASVVNTTDLGGETTRTNLAVNPELTSASTGFNQYYGTTGAGNVARVADPDDAAKWMWRQTWTTATTAVNGGCGFGRSNADDIEVAEGTTITASIAAQPSIQQRLRIEAKFYDDAASQVGSTLYGSSQVLDAGTRARLSYTGAVPTGATRLVIQLAAVAASGYGVVWPISSTLHVGYVLVEVSSTVGSYFSGATSGAAWTGTAGASTSTWVRVGVLYSGDLGQTVAPVVSPEFTGSRPKASGQALATNYELSTGLAAKFAALAGWATSTAYAVYDTVYHAGIFYYCLTAHTSGTWATDYAAGKWRVFSPMHLSLLTPPQGIDDYVNAAWARAHPPVHHLPPTVTYLASGFSLTTQLGSGYQEEVWNVTTKVDTIGHLSESVTAAAVTFSGNKSNGAGPRQPYDLEFILEVPTLADGKFVVSVNDTVTDPLPGAQVFVNGRPHSANMTTDSGASTSTMRALNVTGLPTGRNLICVTLQAMNWRSVAVTSAAQISARGKSRTKVVILGDSWIEGGNDTSSKHAGWPHAIAPTLARLLGDDVACYFAGQGSTGYTTTPGAPKTAYGNSDRLSPITTIAPGYVIVWGTQNDDANHASVQAAATAMFSAIGTNVPAAQIIVVGPPATRYDGAGNRTSNTAALVAAAAGATNVLGGTVISPYTNKWMTGNGKLGTTDGEGIADYAMHSDQNHPTVFGAAYHARRAHFEIARLLLTATPGGRGITL